MLGSRGRQLPFRFAAQRAGELAALCRGHGATLYMALLAGFAALLARAAGVADLVVGSPIANRHRHEVEHLVGLFVNTLALRCRPAAGACFDGLLGQVRETALTAYAHQDLPFDKLVEELAAERTGKEAGLFVVSGTAGNLIALLAHTGRGGEVVLLILLIATLALFVVGYLTPTPSIYFGPEDDDLEEPEFGPSPSLP